LAAAVLNLAAIVGFGSCHLATVPSVRSPACHIQGGPSELPRNNGQKVGWARLSVVSPQS
jgi:hypothetical protein